MRLLAVNEYNHSHFRWIGATPIVVVMDGHCVLSVWSDPASPKNIFDCMLSRGLDILINVQSTAA